MSMKGTQPVYYVEFIPAVFVFLLGCNKLPQMKWLKTKQTYYLTVLGVRSKKCISPG